MRISRPQRPNRSSWQCVSSVALGALLASSMAACSAAPRPASEARPERGQDSWPLLEERALLLLLEDRQLFEPVVVGKFADGPPELREMLAVALGRIGDPQGRPYLEILLADALPEVRREAAFALGELGEARSVPALLRAAVDPDPETGMLAIEALAKLEAPLPEVDRALLALPEAERWPRLLPPLFRFKAAGVVPLAEAGLALPDPELHFRAAYALGREPRPEGARLLRTLLADADPLVRGWATRGLGIVGEAADVELLRPLLDDAASTPVIQALRATRRLIAEGKAAAPAAWVPRLLELYDDPRNGVGLTAIEASAVWLLDEALAEPLRARAGSGAGRVREVALLALAEGKDPRAAELAGRAALAPEASLRARAAEAAGRLGELEVIGRLESDASPGVRAAALQARLDAAESTVVPGTADAPAPPPSAEAVSAARRALADPDPIVRATALDWLAEHPALHTNEIQAALAASARDDLNDARLAAARALRARAEAVAPERTAASEALRKLGADRDFLVRREAGAALGALQEPVPAPGAATLERELGIYRDIVRQTRAAREVDIETAHGTIRLRLFCVEAPLTCLNFLQLAGQGYFDGIAFHRVVPDFVAQGGDPRGDGSGGPGYSIRDEINRHRYTRGAVGMALSGPDTGGSQFFIALTPQPHLDGGYTVFGEVASGMEIAERLVQGDRMLKVTPVPLSR